MTIPTKEFGCTVNVKWTGVQIGAASAMVGCWFILRTAWPTLSVVFIGAALLHIVGAVLVLRSHSFARSFLIATAALLLVVGALISTSLLSLGVFLWAVFGDPGYEAFTDLVVLASVIYVLLEPSEFLKLRFLTAGRPGGPKRWMRRYSLLTCIPLLVSLGVWFWARDHEQPQLAESEETIAIKYLRALIEQTVPPDVSPLAEIDCLPKTQLYVSFHRGDRLVTRVSGRGETLDQALVQAAQALRGDPRFLGHRITDGRLTIHRVVGLRDLPSTAWILGVWVDPSRDGVERRSQDLVQVILPDVLGRRPDPPALLHVPGFLNLRLGIDGGQVLEDLKGVDGPLRRLRFEEITEKE